MEDHARAMKTVYTIVDRGGKTYWLRIGVGFTNRDGSLNLRLDAVPVNATLHVRDWDPAERRPDNGEARGRSQKSGHPSADQTPLDSAVPGSP